MNFKEHPFWYYIKAKSDEINLDKVSKNIIVEAQYYTELCKYTIPDTCKEKLKFDYNKFLSVRNSIKQKIATVLDDRDKKSKILLQSVIFWNMNNINTMNKFYMIKTLLSFGKSSIRSKFNMINFKMFPNIDDNISSKDLLPMKGRYSIFLTDKFMYGNAMQYVKSSKLDMIYIFVTDKIKYNEIDFLKRVMKLNKRIILIYVNNKINVSILPCLKPLK